MLCHTLCQGKTFPGKLRVRETSRAFSSRNFSATTSRPFLFWRVPLPAKCYATLFAREKLFPGNFASEKLRGRFLRETFPRQLRDRFFFEEFLCRLNVAPKTFPRLNFFQAKTFSANVAETFFSKTFSVNFPPIFFPQKNFSRETSRLKLFPG